MDIDGLITRASKYTWADTVDRLLGAMRQLGIEPVARINHAADAHKAGLPLLASEVIIFGNPAVGTLLMQSAPTIALELPLKILVWQDASGTTNVSYNQPEWLANRHGLECHRDRIRAMSQMMRKFAELAVMPELTDTAIIKPPRPQSTTNFSEEIMKNDVNGKSRLQPELNTPNILDKNDTLELADALNVLLADVFALYLKTKNFHWHMSGPHFRDFHLLLDEQAEQIFASTDAIAERVRKIGGNTIRSAGHIKRIQRLNDNDADFVAPDDMLAELRDDNILLAGFMRMTHELCDQFGDMATASLLENWLDETEQRVWFLFESARKS